MAIKVNWNDKGVIFSCTGVVKRTELLNAVNNNFYKMEKSVNIEYQIIDCSEVEEIIISMEDIINFAANDIGRSIYHKNVKFAFVGNKEIVTAIFNTYKTNINNSPSSWAVNLFNSIDKALVWINTN